MNKKLVILFLTFFCFTSLFAYPIEDYKIRETEQCTVYSYEAETYYMNAYFYPTMNYARFYFKVKEDFHYKVSEVDIQAERDWQTRSIAKILGFYHYLYGHEKTYYEKSYFDAYEYIVYFED